MQWLGMDYLCPSPSSPDIRIVSCEGNVFHVSSEAAQYSNILRIALERWTARCSDVSWEEENSEQDESIESSRSPSVYRNGNTQEEEEDGSSSSSSGVSGDAVYATEEEQADNVDSSARRMHTDWSGSETRHDDDAAITTSDGGGGSRTEDDRVGVWPEDDCVAATWRNRHSTGGVDAVGMQWQEEEGAEHAAEEGVGDDGIDSNHSCRSSNSSNSRRRNHRCGNHCNRSSSDGADSQHNRRAPSSPHVAHAMPCWSGGVPPDADAAVPPGWPDRGEYSVEVKRSGSGSAGRGGWDADGAKQEGDANGYMPDDDGEEDCVDRSTDVAIITVTGTKRRVGSIRDTSETTYRHDESTTTVNGATIEDNNCTDLGDKGVTVVDDENKKNENHNNNNTNHSNYNNNSVDRSSNNIEVERNDDSSNSSSSSSTHYTIKGIRADTTADVMSSVAARGGGATATPTPLPAPRSARAMDRTPTLLCCHPRTPCLIEKDDENGTEALYLLSRDGVEEVLYTADLHHDGDAPRRDDDGLKDSDSEEAAGHSCSDDGHVSHDAESGNGYAGEEAENVRGNDAGDDVGPAQDEEEEENGLCFDFQYRCARVTRTRITVDLRRRHPPVHSGQCLNALSSQTHKSRRSLSSSSDTTPSGAAMDERLANHPAGQLDTTTTTTSSSSSSNKTARRDHTSSDISRGCTGRSKTREEGHEMHRSHIGCLFEVTSAADKTNSRTVANTTTPERQRDGCSGGSGTAGANSPSSRVSSVAVQLCLRYLNYLTECSDAGLESTRVSSRASGHSHDEPGSTHFAEQASSRCSSSSSSSRDDEDDDEDGCSDKNNNNSTNKYTFTSDDDNSMAYCDTTTDTSKDGHLHRRTDRNRNDGLVCQDYTRTQSAIRSPATPSALPSPLTAPLITLLAPWEVHFLYHTVLHTCTAPAVAVRRVCPELSYLYPESDLRRAEVRAALRVPAPSRARICALLELNDLAEQLQIPSLHALCTAWIADVMIRASYCAQSYAESAEIVRDCFGIADRWTAEEKEVLRIENEWPVGED